jgi:hypothetical protein
VSIASTATFTILSSNFVNNQASFGIVRVTSPTVGVNIRLSRFVNNEGTLFYRGLFTLQQSTFSGEIP